MVHRIDVVRMHIKPERTQLFLHRFAHLHHDLAYTDKAVHHGSSLFVETPPLGAESTLQESDERRSVRGKEARSNMPQTHTDIVQAAARRDEPVVTKRVRHKCGAFSIRPVGWLAYAG